MSREKWPKTTSKLPYPWLGHHLELEPVIELLLGRTVLVEHRIVLCVLQDKVDNGLLDREQVLFRYLVTQAFDDRLAVDLQGVGDPGKDIVDPGLFHRRDVISVDPILDVVVVPDLVMGVPSGAMVVVGVSWLRLCMVRGCAGGFLCGPGWALTLTLTFSSVAALATWTDTDCIDGPNEPLDQDVVIQHNLGRLPAGGPPPRFTKIPQRTSRKDINPARHAGQILPGPSGGEHHPSVA